MLVCIQRLNSMKYEDKIINEIVNELYLNEIIQDIELEGNMGYVKPQFKDVTNNRRW